MSWTVYVLVSPSTQRTYVGITTELTRRLGQHNGEHPGGARSTRQGRPWEVGRTLGPYETRSEALKVEYRLKQRRGKERLQPLAVNVPEDETTQ